MHILRLNDSEKSGRDIQGQKDTIMNAY